MRLTIPTLRIAGALGLAAGLMIGCQDFLGSEKTADPATVDESGSLSLSIRNDSACLGRWHAILDARGAGQPDAGAEAAFLSSCLTEVKPEKGNPKPVVPPALRPDSGMRCKWIVSQIEGGRDSLTVSYRKYCLDECRKPNPHPDTLTPPPPKPHPDSGADTCKMLHDQLGILKPGEPARAELEYLFAAHCKEPLPHDTVVVPPKPAPDDTVIVLPPKPPVPNCDEIRIKLAALDSGTADYARLALTLKEHCPAKPPVPDTLMVPPSTLNCDALRMKMSMLDPNSADYARLAVTLKEHCPIAPTK